MNFVMVIVLVIIHEQFKPFYHLTYLFGPQRNVFSTINHIIEAIAWYKMSTTQMTKNNIFLSTLTKNVLFILLNNGNKIFKWVCLLPKFDTVLNHIANAMYSLLRVFEMKSLLMQNEKLKENRFCGIAQYSWHYICASEAVWSDEIKSICLL